MKIPLSANSVVDSDVRNKYKSFFSREEITLPHNKGPVIIYGGGWHRREMFFLKNFLLTQPNK